MSPAAALCLSVLLAVGTGPASAGPEPPASPQMERLVRLARIPAPTGEEFPLRETLRQEFQAVGGVQDLAVDGLGNLRVNLAALQDWNRPGVLVLAPLDDPTYAVSGFAEGGWLRVVPLGSPAGAAAFHRSMAGSPVWVLAAGGVRSGAFALPSIHLQAGRPGFPEVASAAHLLVDVGDDDSRGSPSRQPALLDRIVPQGEASILADGSVVAFGIGRRAIAAAVEAARRGGALPALALVAQSQFRGRGLRTLRDVLDELAERGGRVILLEPGRTFRTSPRRFHRI
ncbi:MAG: hypothetical protein ACE5HD_11055 [Acidobacteriota bacterium]